MNYQRLCESMRRVPIDSDFGSPIVVLRNSEVVLFENGTLAEYYQEPFLKFDADETLSNLQDKPYLFFYNHISELANIKIGNPEKLDQRLEALKNIRFKLLITTFFSTILALLYFYSINLGKLTGINNLDNGIQFSIAVFAIILGLGLEELIYNFLNKNKNVPRSLQIQLIHRNDPYIVYEESSPNWSDLFEIHHFCSRFVILASCFYIPSVKDLNQDFITFFEMFVFCNILIYIVVISFSPLILLNRFENWKQRKSFTKVKDIDFKEFFECVQNQIKESKQSNEIESKATLSELISADESNMKEFKGSIWTAYNPKTYEKIKTQSKKRLDLQDAIVKSVASFLNTDGGVLLIGVKDKPHVQEEPILGIEDDFQWVKGKDAEGYQHALIQLVNDAFGDQSTLKIYLDISFPTIRGKMICRINVDPLPRTRNGELWVKTQTLGKEEFFYRVSDTTTHASAKSANRYIRHHFEGFSVETDDQN